MPSRRSKSTSAAGSDSAAAALTKKVRFEQLQWKPVDLPDRMDDYEGFYGLEEIDDVAVMKDEQTGLVSYHSTGPSTHQPSPDADAAADSSGEEFQGFGDIEPAPTRPITKGVKRSSPPTEEHADHDVRPSAKKQKKGTVPVVSAFAAVAEADDKQEVDVSAWRSLDLSPDTLAALARLGFAAPTPIQSAAIPEIVSGRDVIGKASTGSGKTLAFGIPIYEKFLQDSHERKYTKGTDDRRPPLALIVTPTRELAHQLAKHLDNLSAGLVETRPIIATLTGGLSIQKQQRILATADIVIGTPGRLWEIMSSGTGIVTWLRKIRYLVIDEADRLLSHGNFKELQEVLKALDQEQINDSSDAGSVPHADLATEEAATTTRQTLVFSATFHKGLQQKLAGKGRPNAALADKAESMEYLLAKLKFHDQKPKYVDVNPSKQMAGGLNEGLVECGGTEKDLYLYSILLLHPSTRSLVFVNSISAVRRIVPFLQNLGLGALALHSQMPQKARLRSIERFTNPVATTSGATSLAARGSVLVATDVAARGLDIPGVQLVVHYHLPRASDSYVHRSGRTARAGESGSSILICGPEEVAGVRRLIGKVHAGSSGKGHFIRTLNIDRRVVGRLKPRAVLAKQLADVSTANEKKSSQTELFKSAADDLGVEYDSEELERNDSKGKRGRGAGRLKKEREARALSKDEVRSIRAELGQLLRQRVNIGVSERYLTSGAVDIDELLRAGDGVRGDFLGLADGTGLDD